jgi:hypothetical protein
LFKKIIKYIESEFKGNSLLITDIMGSLSSKHLIFCFGLAAFAANSPLMAGYSVLSNLQTQVKMLEEKIAIIEEKTALGKQGAQLADGQPILKDNKGVSLGLDVLYFKTQLGGTAFVYSTTGAESPSYPILGSTKEIKFNMDFGLRAHVEKRFIENDWRVGLEYTWFRTTKSNQAKSGIVTSQIPLKGILILGDGVAFAKSNAEVAWNDLSLYLDKSYFVSQTLLVKPLIGLKSSWILLNQWSRYTGGDLSNNTDHVKDQSKFFGIGPNIGNWLEWFLGKGFSFAGWMDIALEYGMYHIQYKENQSNLPTSNIVLNQTKHQFSPIFDFGLKVNYGTYFGKNRFYLKAGLGYEMVYFLNQNQAIQLFNSGADRIQNISQDLSLNGLNGSISLSF